MGFIDIVTEYNDYEFPKKNFFFIVCVNPASDNHPTRKLCADGNFISQSGFPSEHSIVKNNKTKDFTGTILQDLESVGVKNDPTLPMQLTTKSYVDIKMKSDGIPRWQIDQLLDNPKELVYVF